MTNASLLRRWAEWLGCNGHRQARGALRRVQRDGSVHWCALGGLEEMSGTDVDVLFCRTLESACLTHVVRLNDEIGWTFVEIARWLECMAEGILQPAEALGIEDPGQLERLKGRQGLQLEACG